jgi:hypothetical protein
MVEEDMAVADASATAISWLAHEHATQDVIESQ